MRNSTVPRRAFLRTAAASALSFSVSPGYAQNASQGADEIALFLKSWDEAWNQHDPAAIAALHAQDAVTVNRFGTVIYGRAGTQKAMEILHKKGGIFSDVSFPPQTIENVHRLPSGVVIVQTRWQNPSVSSDGKAHPDKLDDMVVTYVLENVDGRLQIAQLDLHNVVKLASHYPDSITHKS